MHDCPLKNSKVAADNSDYEKGRRRAKVPRIGSSRKTKAGFNEELVVEALDGGTRFYQLLHDLSVVFSQLHHQKLEPYLPKHSHHHHHSPFLPLPPQPHRRRLPPPQEGGDLAAGLPPPRGGRHLMIRSHRRERQRSLRKRILIEDVEGHIHDWAGTHAEYV
ncbi:uncharacterized protein G2W53_000511 [Senna tora]|uniref:Uncharacterized protein n=1 Tax=Senna tora TaxID=362788 RepID=A0A834XGP3_9FABA|nr:uncharacterized protein G2W53_000511 [Senna tora]